MPRRKPTPVATRHGATQPENERKAKAVLLRLQPDVIEMIDDIRGTMQRSAYVTRLVRLDAADRARVPRLPGDAS